jgi:intraflagellar transport protein 74
MYVQSRHGKPGTNVRLNTGLRMPTGYNQSKQVSTLNQPFLNLGERPITQQGIMGMKPTTAGPKRKVLSRSYFLVLMKQKISELTTEIATFREQKEQLVKSQEASKNIEANHTTLTNEVRELEGSLADYNLALDKQRTGTRPDDLNNVKEHIAFQNQKLRNQIDNVFLERKTLEEKIASIEDRIHELKESAELKLNELSSKDREEYKKLEATLRDLQATLKIKIQNLEDLSRKILDQESQIRMDVSRIKMIQLKEGITRFEEKKKDLEDKISENSMSFEVLRGRLMERVKTEKTEIQALEKRVKELRKLGESVAKKLNKLVDDLKGGSEINEDQKKKYEILYEKEKEINAFLENFETIRQKRFEELQTLESANLRLVDVITKNMNLIKHAPSQRDFEEMSKEINFKRQQAENSEETLKRLQLEHLRRQEELQRVDEIEDTLPERIKQFKAMIETMKLEIIQFDKKDTEKKNLQQKVEFLKSKINVLGESRDEINRKAESAQKEYSNQLGKLQSHENFTQFVEVEKQLSQVNQLAFGIQNYIQNKENECDFGPQVAEIMQVTNEINALLIA